MLAIVTACGRWKLQTGKKNCVPGTLKQKRVRGFKKKERATTVKTQTKSTSSHWGWAQWTEQWISNFRMRLLKTWWSGSKKWSAAPSMSTRMGKKASPLLADSFSFSTIKNSYLLFQLSELLSAAFPTKQHKINWKTAINPENRDSSAVRIKRQELKLAATWRQGKCWLAGGVRRGCLICPCSVQVASFHSKPWILNARLQKTSFLTII